MVGPPRPRFASSRKAAPLDLPDGPVDEDVQDALLQELLRRQDAAEKAFSRVLTAFDFAVGCLWLLAAYWHAEKPWPPPFDAFRQRGQGAERVAMMALVLGALSCFLSAFSGVMGNGSSARENRAIHVGATAALASAVLWAWLATRTATRASLSPVLWLAMSAGLLGPIAVQVFFLEACSGTRAELRRLESLKYRCKNA